MTKREICEELWNIANGVSFERGHISGEEDENHAIDRATDALDYVRRALRMLLLNISVPETEEEKAEAFRERCRAVLGDLAAPVEEKPKAEEKHPGVIAKPGKDGEIEWCWCQKCYAQAAVVHDPFGDGENWSYCQKCGVSFRLKRGEGEK